MKINYAIVQYEINENNKIHFTYYCNECGTISNIIDKDEELTVQLQLRHQIDKHEKLHYMTHKGELTEKFITMVKAV